MSAGSTALVVSVDGVEVVVTKFMFNKFNFKSSKIVSGDKYYIDKAIEKGAEKKRRAKKSEE